jgi:LuxR family maltose regulon positive regulatory protein
VIEAAILLALAHAAGGDPARALDVLADALARAEPERFVRLFLDAGPPMTALLEAAVRHDRAAAQASTLLRAVGLRRAPRPEPASSTS